MAPTNLERTSTLYHNRVNLFYYLFDVKRNWANLINFNRRLWATWLYSDRCWPFLLPLFWQSATLHNATWAYKALRTFLAFACSSTQFQIFIVDWYFGITFAFWICECRFFCVQCDLPRPRLMKKAYCKFMFAHYIYEPVHTGPARSCRLGLSLALGRNI